MIEQREAEYQRTGYVGIINGRTSPSQVAEVAAMDAKLVCEVCPSLRSLCHSQWIVGEIHTDLLIRHTMEWLLQRRCIATSR